MIVKEKVDKLKSKLEEAKINFQEYIPDNPDFNPRMIFDIPAGREKNECYLVYRDELLDKALSCNFEKFRFIKGYEAIWSKELGIIEAEVSSADIPSRFFFNKLNRLINKHDEAEEEENEEEATKVELPSLDGLHISIGYCSNEFLLLTGCRERGPMGRNSRRNTLRIVNLKISTHDAILETLEKIANSLFFQIDLSFEMPIFLANQRESWLERRNKRMRKQVFVDETAIVSELKYEYDPEPISLYWYAKELTDIPIFQYLAFYQTIEFYFPVYSSFEAKQKIQSLIKDPRFNPNRDSDISKIISTIKASSNGKTFGNEREQLRATVNACTNNKELRDFFEVDEKRSNFYLENKEKNISKQKISFKNDNVDLVMEVTERIYEIRCRIVHSKATEGDFEVLLPYSNEVQKLNYDLELIEFISRKVLITSSRSIRL